MNRKSPSDVAREGERIYAQKYQAACERDRPGQFVAIDTKSGAMFAAEHAEEALKKATSTKPTGLFHLIRVGSASAFHVGMMGLADADCEWAF